MEKPAISEIERVSRIFKVLSDVTRLKIVLSLEAGERNVTSIAETVEMEQSAVSHQLKLLRENNVVKSRREGKTILYSLDDHHEMKELSLTESSFFFSRYLVC
jgi:DNA-binding transcriptional ArsR family regulator